MQSTAFTCAQLLLVDQTGGGAERTEPPRSVLLAVHLAHPCSLPPPSLVMYLALQLYLRPAVRRGPARARACVREDPHAWPAAGGIHEARMRTHARPPRVRDDEDCAWY